MRDSAHNVDQGPCLMLGVWEYRQTFQRLLIKLVIPNLSGSCITMEYIERVELDKRLFGHHSQ